MYYIHVCTELLCGAVIYMPPKSGKKPQSNHLAVHTHLRGVFPRPFGIKQCVMLKCNNNNVSALKGVIVLLLI